jgi:hypothetical protein
MLLGTHVLPHDLVMGLTSVAYVPLVALWWRGARAELRPDQ